MVSSWAKVWSQVFQELTGNFEVLVLVLYLRHLDFEKHVFWDRSSHLLV